LKQHISLIAALIFVVSIVLIDLPVLPDMGEYLTPACRVFPQSPDFAEIDGAATP
jgi:hypothetical protein